MLYDFGEKAASVAMKRFANAQDGRLGKRNF
jgi:hypothetical protein